MEIIGAKPIGVIGRLAGLAMNLVHAKQYKKIIRKFIVNRNCVSEKLTILDIGCGGGKTKSLFSSICKNALIYGLDHSLDMVNLSKRVNKSGIKKGTVDILQSDVKNLPYSDNYFDVISAFDTISFWDDIDSAINEIRRVLKPKGRFFIVNGYPKEGSKWYEVVKFKTDEEYRSFLKRHGFSEIEISIERNTIIIKANK
jgi:ubiquinone/menaquinone biosynthesis C-methylase UbiE